MEYIVEEARVATFNGGRVSELRAQPRSPCLTRVNAERVEIESLRVWDEGRG